MKTQREHLGPEFQFCFISEEKKFLKKWPSNSKLSHSLGFIGADDAQPLLQNHSVSLILYAVECDELSVVAADPLTQAILQPSIQKEHILDGFVLSLCRPWKAEETSWRDGSR